MNGDMAIHARQKIMPLENLQSSFSIFLALYLSNIVGVSVWCAEYQHECCRKNCMIVSAILFLYNSYITFWTQLGQLFCSFLPAELDLEEATFTLKHVVNTF